MGKTTRYHPYSLPLIRGMAAYEGIKLTNIRQTTSSIERGIAWYNCNLKMLVTIGGAEDKDQASYTPDQVRARLRAAFSGEVELSSCGWHSKKGWWCTLYAHPQEWKTAAPVDLPWYEHTQYDHIDLPPVIENEDRSVLRCENCHTLYKPGTGQPTVFGGWFCNDCLD
jgi:hypothetical protein